MKAISNWNLLAVDFQRDFACPEGRWFRPRACHSFVSNVLVPWLTDNEIRLSEIISDYRLPRPNETEAYCVPGTPGYESVIDLAVKRAGLWIKSMNNPTWVRRDEPNGRAILSSPECKPSAFTKWVHSQFGPPSPDSAVIVFGLTLDCCVLCTVQELYYRGYRVMVLEDGVDSYNSAENKTYLLNTVISNWAGIITWDQFLELTRQSSQG